MNAVKIRRADPRRPSLTTVTGVRRIVLGSDEGERGVHLASAQAAARKPLRSAGPFTGCLLAVVQAERGALDEHAREVIAAAAVLARPDEAVRVLVLGDCGEDLAAAGADCAEVLPLDGRYQPAASAAWVHDRISALQPRHVLWPDRGTEGDLGRRVAALSGLRTAAQVVELGRQRLRVRAAAGQDACAPLPEQMLIRRHAARAELPFVGQGEASVAPSLAPSADGVEDLGLEAGAAGSVPLEEAELILAAGNGVHDVELFSELAQALGAATGASRVAVDDGRFPRSKQIGATGKTVQARGYVAFGISGAVQHLQGIKDCRHVIAVNTDPAAPISQRAELTVVEDAQALMRALLDVARAARAAAHGTKEGQA